MCLDVQAIRDTESCRTIKYAVNYLLTKIKLRTFPSFTKNCYSITVTLKEAKILIQFIPELSLMLFICTY